MEIKTRNIGDHRHYYDASDPDTLYPSVTSILDMLPAGYLSQWHGDMAARLAVQEARQLADMDPDRAYNYLRYAAKRHRDHRADVGTYVHDKICEPLLLGKSLGRIQPDMRPYADAMQQFLDVVQPEVIHAELTAWSDWHRYAGRFDAALRVRVDEEGNWDPTGAPAVCMADWKTSKSLSPKVALQMAAYARADKIVDADGTVLPVPRFEHAFALHMAPDPDDPSRIVWRFVPIRTDLEQAFSYFLSLLHEWQWVTSDSKKALGTPSAQGRSK